MFKVEAKQDVVITGFNVVSKKDTANDVMIYTRLGSYEGEPLRQNGWKPIFQGNIPNQQNKLSKLDDFNEPVTIIAGDTQSFYVYSSKGLMYTLGDKEGKAYADNDALVMYEGKVTSNEFRRPNGSGMWAGVIKYHTV